MSIACISSFAQHFTTFGNQKPTINSQHFGNQFSEASYVTMFGLWCALTRWLQYLPFTQREKLHFYFFKTNQGICSLKNYRYDQLNGKIFIFQKESIKSATPRLRLIEFMSQWNHFLYPHFFLINHLLPKNSSLPFTPLPPAIQLFLHLMQTAKCWKMDNFISIESFAFSFSSHCDHRTVLIMSPYHCI